MKLPYIYASISFDFDLQWDDLRDLKPDWFDERNEPTIEPQDIVLWANSKEGHKEIYDFFQGELDYFNYEDNWNIGAISREAPTLPLPLNE